MSKVGNSKYTLGNVYNIYCSDMSVKELKEYKEKLPSTSIIVSSPTNNGEDIGNPSLAITDYNGSLLPLTYAFNNKDFVVNNSTNTVSLNFDLVELLNRIDRLEKALLKPSTVIDVYNIPDNIQISTPMQEPKVYTIDINTNAQELTAGMVIKQGGVWHIIPENTKNDKVWWKLNGTETLDFYFTDHAIVELTITGDDGSGEVTKKITLTA